jgi:membrane fusion protein, heavy metal efflux system
VMTPFSGRVTRLIAKVGDQVRRGDPLLEIDSPDQVPPQNDFIAAQTARNKARSQLSLAQIVEKRARDLYEGKATPVQGIAAAEAQLVAAENDMRSTDTAFEAARIRLRIVGRTDTEITALEQHGTITRVTPINAPIDGTVISRKVGPGQLVKADSGEALYVIADLSTMWLKAQIFEQEIASLRVGQEMEAKVAAAPNRIFKARPAVPTVAVIREGDVATVWVETEPMLFKRRVVEIGIQQEGFTQVRSGLAIGELVVARGAIFVDDGVASRIFRLGVIDAA